MIYLAAIAGFVASMYTAGTIGGLLTGLATSFLQGFTKVLIACALNAVWIVLYRSAVNKKHKEDGGVLLFEIIEVIICAVFILMLFFTDSTLGRIGFTYVASMALLNWYLLHQYQYFGDYVSIIPNQNEREEIEKQVEEPKEITVQVVLDLIETIQKKEFYPPFGETIKYLSAIKEKDISIKKVMLGQIYSLLRTYQLCIDDPVESEASDKAKEHIEEAFTIVNQALSKIYDNAFAAKTFDVDAEITALKEKMEQDNLINSDKQLKF